MALTSLILILVFTALYLHKSLEKKPEVLTKVVDKITPHIDQVGFWGVIYGLVAMVLTLLFGYSSLDMLVRLLTNFMIALMALPFVLDRLIAFVQQKVSNPVIIDEIRNLVGWVSKNERFIGYMGALCSVVLFVVLFK